MIQKAIGVLVLFVWSAFALAQGDGAIAGEAVNPLTKPPFSEMVGVWRPVGEPDERQLWPGEMQKHFLRWATLGESGRSLYVGEIVHLKGSDGSESFIHTSPTRFDWDEAGRAIMPSYPDLDFLGMAESSAAVLDNESVVVRFESRIKATVILTETVAGKVWKSHADCVSKKDGESRTWSQELTYRRLHDFPAIQIPTLKEHPQRIVELNVFSFSTGKNPHFLLVGDCVAYEYRDAGYGKLIAKLSESQLERFWSELERMRYRNWEPLYDDPGGIDGGSKFDVRISHDGVEVRSSGRNNGPPEPEGQNHQGLGRILALQSELYRLIAESDEVYLVPGWTDEPTLKRE